MRLCHHPEICANLLALVPMLDQFAGTALVQQNIDRKSTSERKAASRRTQNPYLERIQQRIRLLQRPLQDRLSISTVTDDLIRSIGPTSTQLPSG
jgi:hypothetical protein